MADVSLLFNVLVRDNTGPGLNSASSRMDKFRAGVSKAAVGVVGVAAAAGAATVKSAAAQSSAIAAWTQVTGVEMDKQQQSIARSLNLSQTDYAKSYTTLSSLYQSNGIARDDANKMAAKGLKIAADQAAFGNTTVGEAVEAQAGLLKGSGELLEKYSISITAADVAARMKADGTDKLTGAEKKVATATAKAALMQEQSAKFSGQAARESKSLESRQQALAATIEDMKAKIGTKLLPVVEKFIGKLQGMADWVENNQTKAKLLLTVVGALAAVVVTAAIGMKAYRAALMVARAATAAYTGVMWLLNAAFLANPIVGVIAVLVLLGIALVVAYKKSETFRKIVNAAFGAVKKFFVGMWDTMRFAAAKGIQIIGGMYITFADGVLGVFEMMARGLGKLPKILGGGVGDKAAEAIAGIRGGLQSLKDKLDELPTEHTITFKSNADSIRGSIILMKNAAAASGVATSSGSTTSSGGGTMQGRYGGERANGGPVRRGMTYLVGERGPELFTARSNGSILPNGSLGGSVAGNARMGSYKFGFAVAIAQEFRNAIGAAAKGMAKLRAEMAKMKDPKKLAEAAKQMVTLQAEAAKALADSAAATAAKVLDRLKERFEKAKDMARGIKASFLETANVTGLGPGGAGGFAAMMAELKKKADAAAAFGKGITSLRKRGLNATSLAQLVAAGPDQGLGAVEAMMNGGKGAVGQVNALVKQIGASGGGLGEREAIAQYGVNPNGSGRVSVKIGRQKLDVNINLGSAGDDLTEAIVRAMRKKIRTSGGNVQSVLGAR